MKIRKGFVSNSSSSSFVCDVCGENVSGWDMGLRDAQMFECTGGHTVCDSHAVSSSVDFYDLEGFEAKRSYCLARAKYDSTKEQINNAEHEGELDDLYSDEIEYDERHNTLAEDCPCCTLKSPTDFQVLEFLLSEVNASKEEVAERMRVKFGNYKKMCDELEL